MRLSKIKIILALLFCVIPLMCVPQSGQAYYGGPFGTPYGINGFYGNLYGGVGWNYNNPFGSLNYGLNNGFLYGGQSPYYRFGGLYGGWPGLSGLSIFGLNGLYGGLGLYGTGLYGLGSPLSGLGLWGNGFLGTGRLGLGGNVAPIADFIRTSAILTGTTGGGGASIFNPTGYWNGTWVSSVTLRNGLMNMNLAYNPVDSSVAGSAALLINELIPTSIQVIGLYTGATFTVTGSYLDLVTQTIYYEELTCTQTSPLTMTGEYLIYNLQNTITDYGVFDLILG